MKTRKIGVLVVIVSLVFSFSAWAKARTEVEPEEEAESVVQPRTTKYNEAPMLAELVAKGELPSVDERLPKEPSVLDWAEEIGKYGGTLNVFAIDNSAWNDAMEAPPRQHYLLRLGRDGTTVEGDLAESYALAEDDMSLTIYLREGTKWSDGAPFTVDDIIFMFEDIHFDKNVESWNPWGFVKDIERIDDHTVRFNFSEPSGERMVLMLLKPQGSNWFSHQPKHYLQKWHVDYNADAEKLAKEEGFDTWSEAFHYHFWWVPQKDIDKPSVEPWIIKEFTTTYRACERNPYYWTVDKAGNQLPYIDKLLSTIIDPEAYQLKAISGEADVAFVNLTFENYTLYKESENTGNYTTVVLPGLNASDIGFAVNLNHPDPVLREINQDLRYRKALSHAIDREEINDVIYHGLAVPRQVTVLPNVSYFKDEWANASIEYDPQEANRLLDEVGLDKRGKDGFRLRPDGKPMRMDIEYSLMSGAKANGLEIVKEYLENAGIKVLLKYEEPALFNERRNSSDHDVIAPVYAGNAGEIANITWKAEFWRDWGADYSYCYEWGLWLQAEEQIELGKMTLADYGGEMPGEEPPEEWKQVTRWVRERAYTRLGSKEYTDLSEKIYDFHAKNLYMIGVLGMVPDLIIAKNNLGNIPQAYRPEMGEKLELNYFVASMFFRD